MGARGLLHTPPEQIWTPSQPQLPSQTVPKPVVGQPVCSAMHETARRGQQTATSLGAGDIGEMGSHLAAGRIGLQCTYHKSHPRRFQPRRRGNSRCTGHPKWATLGSLRTLYLMNEQVFQLLFNYCT